LIRPVTLWPFPKEIIRKVAEKGVSFLVIEDNIGQMIMMSGLRCMVTVKRKSIY